MSPEQRSELIKLFRKFADFQEHKFYENSDFEYEEISHNDNVNSTVNSLLEWTDACCEYYNGIGLGDDLVISAVTFMVQAYENDKNLVICSYWFDYTLRALLRIRFELRDSDTQYADNLRQSLF